MLQGPTRKRGSAQPSIRPLYLPASGGIGKEINRLDKGYFPCGGHLPGEVRGQGVQRVVPALLPDDPLDAAGDCEQVRGPLVGPGQGPEEVRPGLPTPTPSAGSGTPAE